MSYLIKNATVVSVDKDIGTVSPCDVLIQHGLIVAVGPNLKAPASPPSEKSGCIIIDGTDTIVSPGFIDTHRHTWQTQLRSIASDYILSDYALSLRYVYGSCYTAEDVYIGNLCGALEAVDSGTTCLVDHSHIINTPEHADRAVQALRDAQIRGVFCYCLYSNPAWEGSCLDADREKDSRLWRLEDAKRVRKTHFPGSNGPEQLLRFGFAPSEPDMASFDVLAYEIEWARKLGAATITAHVSQGKWDPGNRFVEKLGSKGLLGSDLLFSHANSLAPEEVRMVRDHKVGLSITPSTEYQMAFGNPIAFHAHDHGCRVGLGVDVCCSCPGDIFQQMRLLVHGQRHLEHGHVQGVPSTISRRCAEVLELATLGGAQALGLDAITGSVTPGKQADIIITRCDSLRMTPMHHAEGALVLYANPSDIDSVFINGKLVKSGGKLRGVDWPKLRGQLTASTKAIMKRAERAPVGAMKASVEVAMRKLAAL